MREELTHGDARRVPRWIADLRELGQVAIGGVVEREPAVVAQAQDGGGGEALADRGDAKHGVGVDVGGAPGGATAEALRVHQLAVDDVAVSEAGRAEPLALRGDVRVERGDGGEELGAPLGIAEDRRGERRGGEARGHGRRRGRAGAGEERKERDRAKKGIAPR